MKMQPATYLEKQEMNASQRISTLFMELLERQFPVDEDHRKIHLRSASDFADQLNVHVNHLNRAVKENMQKTTTEIITERLLKESKILLRHSNWDFAEIAYALDFKEATHFSNFFKKHASQSPTQFRRA
jgi:AraC-like DNA-binding protein